MHLRNYNHGKFFNPVQIYMGYVFIACGLLFSIYSPGVLALIIPGTFMAFTYTGTILDTEHKRVKPYDSYFGFIKAGKWSPTDQFTRFSIQKTTRKYTTYSRGSVRFDMNVSDIQLALLSRNNNKNVLIGIFNSFEEAQKEMEDLSLIIFDKEMYGNQNNQTQN